MLKSDVLQQLQQLKKDIKASRPLFIGIVKGTRQRFGFVTLRKDGRDIFLAPDEMSKVFPGDEVEIEVKQDKNGKDFGILERLIESPLKQFVGRCVTKGQAHFIEPDLPGFSRWLFLPPNKRRKVKEGDYISCRIIQHPLKTGKPQAEVLTILGRAGEPDIERRYSLSKRGITDDWNNACKTQLAEINENLITELAKNRIDLTMIPFVTIDAASTQDMDDALYAEKTDDGWLLRVAVADPTAMIKPDSPLEKALLQKATTIYLPGIPVPMLPEKISSQLCSLRPNENRLAKVCNIRINKDGIFKKPVIENALICSHAKLSYKEASALLSKEDSSPDNMPVNFVLPVLHSLKACSDSLFEWRKGHALISENKPEFQLVLDKNQQITEILSRDQTPAHKIVEECMIAANRAVTQILQENTENALYIGHSGIRTERQDALMKAVKATWSDWTSPDVNILDDFKTLMTRSDPGTAITGAPEPRPTIRSIALRQLARTRLTLLPTPHFGMGLPAYTTFTSPLRKANDFLVHRLLDRKENPFTPLSSAQLTQLQKGLMNARLSASELTNWLKCQFMASHIGETFDAVIIHTHSSGFLVRLTQNGIEGAVSTKEMTGKYSFDQSWLSLKNKATQYVLGQEIRVTLDSIDDSRHQLILTVVLPENDTDQ